MDLALNNENNKVTIANAGGIDAIESAKRNHSSNADVQEKGDEALYILTPTEIPTTSSLYSTQLF